MSAGPFYEVWMCDAFGNRFWKVTYWSFLNWERIVHGVDNVDLGVPYDIVKDALGATIFQRDWQLQVWRQPGPGLKSKLVRPFFLRKPKIYTRKEDNVTIVQYQGHGPLKLLARRYVIQAAGTAYTRKTATIDDMMKAVVREQMLYNSARDEDGNVDNDRAWPQNYFRVQADNSLGTTLTNKSVFGRNVLDVLKELATTSLQIIDTDAGDALPIYFDVVPVEPNVFEFQTFLNQQGRDLRGKTVAFGLENEDLEAPFYEFDTFDEITAAYVAGQGEGESRTMRKIEERRRINLSPWNRIEYYQDARDEPSNTGLDERGKTTLAENTPFDRLYGTFLNTPGGTDTPRSLYGIDWDVGDQVTVSYADKVFDTNVRVVYGSIDENGKETLYGRNEIGGEPVIVTTQPQPSGLLDGLVSYYTLDEASGNRADSHNGNTLTDINTVTSRAGKINDAASFDDANSEALEIDSAIIPGPPFTVSLWCVIDDDTLNQALFCLIDRNDANEQIRLMAGGNRPGDPFTIVIVDGGASYFTDAGKGFVAGTWYHVVMVIASEDDRRIYVDGGNAGVSSDFSAPTGFDRTSLGRIGWLPAPFGYLDGAVDECGIWNRALSPSEVSELYNSGAGLAYPFS